MATTVTADDTSVTFTALDGQVVTFSEYSTNATFTGTDINNGGCAPATGGNCHFRHALRSGPIVPALKNAGHTDRRQ
jgi:hypothetical protein